MPLTGVRGQTLSCTALTFFFPTHFSGDPHAVPVHQRAKCHCNVAAAAHLAGRQLGTGGHASCRTSCKCGACAPGMGAWTGGDPSKVAASVFCTTTLSRPHHRLYQPWVAAPRSGAGARKARERTSCATRRSDSSFHRPPVSHASMHSLCGPRRRSSG